MCMPCTWLTCETAELMGLCTAGTQKVEVLWQVKSSLSLEVKRSLSLSLCHNKTQFQTLFSYTYLFISLSLSWTHNHLSHAITTVHTHFIPTNLYTKAMRSVNIIEYPIIIWIESNISQIFWTDYNAIVSVFIENTEQNVFRVSRNYRKQIAKKMSENAKNRG